MFNVTPIVNTIIFIFRNSGVGTQSICLKLNADAINKKIIIQYRYPPFYMPEQSFLSHSQTTILAQLLAFCDHSAAVFLYERVRLAHRHLHPYLHQQRGLNQKSTKLGRGQQKIYRYFKAGIQ